MVSARDPNASDIMAFHLLPNLPEDWKCVLILFRLPPGAAGEVIQSECSVASNANPDLTRQVMERSVEQMRGNPTFKIYPADQ